MHGEQCCFDIAPSIVDNSVKNGFRFKDYRQLLIVDLRQLEGAEYKYERPLVLKLHVLPLDA